MSTRSRHLRVLCYATLWSSLPEFVGKAAVTISDPGSEGRLGTLYGTLPKVFQNCALPDLDW